MTRYSRRQFLQALPAGLVASAATLLLPTPAIAAARKAKLDDFWTKDRWLALRRQTTGEQFYVPFWVKGKLNYPNYVRLCYILRDVLDRDATVEMDVNLLNLLYGLQEWARLLDKRSPVITVNSGHRTVAHNLQIESAAFNSMHIYGKAADITMEGMDLSSLQSMAVFYGAGGVGIYPTFLHVDVGSVRYWAGPPIKKSRKK